MVLMIATIYLVVLGGLAIKKLEKFGKVFEKSIDKIRALLRYCAPFLKSIIDRLDAVELSQVIFVLGAFLVLIVGFIKMGKESNTLGVTISLIMTAGVPWGSLRFLGKKYGFIR